MNPIQSPALQTHHDGRRALRDVTAMRPDELALEARTLRAWATAAKAATVPEYAKRPVADAVAMAEGIATRIDDAIAKIATLADDITDSAVRVSAARTAEMRAQAADVAGSTDRKTALQLRDDLAAASSALRALEGVHFAMMGTSQQLARIKDEAEGFRLRHNQALESTRGIAGQFAGPYGGAMGFGDAKTQGAAVRDELELAFWTLDEQEQIAAVKPTAVQRGQEVVLEKFPAELAALYAARAKAALDALTARARG